MEQGTQDTCICVHLYFRHSIACDLSYENKFILYNKLTISAQCAMFVHAPLVKSSSTENYHKSTKEPLSCLL